MVFSERVIIVVVCVCFAAAFSRENEEKGEDHSITLKGKAEDVCKLPPSSGPCYGYFEMWFYNTTTKRCAQFVYGGCAGNSNRFENKKECEAKCSGATLTVQPPCAEKLAKVKPGLIGAFTPQCDKDGYYIPKQCWGSVGTCWCVDRLGNKIASAEESPGSRVELDCEYPCLKAYKKALSPAVLLHGEALPLQLNQYIPTCDQEGYYTPKQCHAAVGKCWCVNRLGAKLPDTETTTNTDKLNCG